MHKIYTSLGTGDDVLLVFMDISKAFDRVYHKGLLYKLEAIGIRGHLLNWFRNYLSQRQQRVVLNGQASEWCETNAGVPQGSILGPLLFLIFINDIVDGLTSEPFLFADDTSLFRPLNSDADVDVINLDLQTLSNWAAQWRVNFNPLKTEYMIVSKKLIHPPRPQLYLNNVPIKMVKQHCHLGIWFTDNMSWGKHIQELNSNVSKSLNLLKRMSNKIDRKTKLFIYKCYIRPKLEYCTSVYSGNLSKDQIDSLENIQRQALLCAVQGYRHTSHEKLLQESGIEPLSVRRRYFGLCHLYKIIHQLTPNYLTCILPPYVRDTTPYPLRNACDFIIPRTTQNYIKLSFFWNTLYNWNALDITIRESASLNVFKHGLKSLMMSRPNKLFDLSTPKGSVHHSRMRMGLSGLNAHRRKYKFINYNNCPLCGQKPDDTIHFFFKCPYQAMHRNTLVGVLSNILRLHIPNIDQMINTLTNLKLLNSIVLFGSELLSYDDNIVLFKAIHYYIADTKRFDMN